MTYDNMSDSIKRADAAMKEAAEVVLQRARRHKSPIVLWRDGKVVEVDPFSPEFDKPNDRTTAAGDQ